jgi:hypothetical protein
MKTPELVEAVTIPQGARSTGVGKVMAVLADAPRDKTLVAVVFAWPPTQDDKEA